MYDVTAVKTLQLYVLGLLRLPCIFYDASGVSDTIFTVGGDEIKITVSPLSVTTDTCMRQTDIPQNHTLRENARAQTRPGPELREGVVVAVHRVLRRLLQRRCAALR